MPTAYEIISRLSDRGVIFQLKGLDGFRVVGISKLTDQEKVILRAHKPAILQALHQPAEPINDHQGETVSRAPRIKTDPGVMATGVKYGGYAPNCNRCWRYHWRSEICQRQGRLEFANTPPCQGRHYQPFALTLAEREAVAGAIGEGAT